MYSRDHFLRLWYLLIVLTGCGMETLFDSGNEDNAAKYRYALSTAIQSGEPIRVTLSAVRDIDDYSINRPFSGSVDTALILVNGDSLMSVSQFPDYNHRQRAYNYFSDNITPQAGEAVYIQAIIGTDVVAGYTRIPGNFSVMSYTKSILRWTTSEKAQGYIIKGFLKETDDSDNTNPLKWKSIVSQVVFDTSFSLKDYIEYEEAINRLDPDYTVYTESIRVEILSFDDNYYSGILDEELIAGVTNGYGVVASYTFVDTILAN